MQMIKMMKMRMMVKLKKMIHMATMIKNIVMKDMQIANACGRFFITLHNFFISFITFL